MKGCLRISDTSIKKIKSPFGDLLGSPGDGLPERCGYDSPLTCTRGSTPSGLRRFERFIPGVAPPVMHIEALQASVVSGRRRPQIVWR